MIIGSGSFSPGPGHEMRGTFTLTRQSNGILMETSEDFYFDGAPAPGWALSLGVPTNSSDPGVIQAARETDFKRLEIRAPISGKRNALIPENIDIDSYDTLFLWCYEFGVILGAAPINRV